MEAIRNLEQGMTTDLSGSSTMKRDTNVTKLLRWRRDLRWRPKLRWTEGQGFVEERRDDLPGR